MSINWVRVREMQEEIGHDDFLEVAELFLTEVSAAIEALQTGSAVESVEAQLHFIKSSALNLGFSGLSDLCSKGEIEASRGQTSTVSSAMVLDIFLAERDEFLMGAQGSNAAARRLLVVGGENK